MITSDSSQLHQRWVLGHMGYGSEARSTGMSLAVGKMPYRPVLTVGPMPVLRPIAILAFSDMEWYWNGSEVTGMGRTE